MSDSTNIVNVYCIIVDVYCVQVIAWLHHSKQRYVSGMAYEHGVLDIPLSLSYASIFCQSLICSFVDIVTADAAMTMSE